VGHAVQSGRELHVLDCGERAIQHALVRDEPDQAPRLGVAPQLAAGDMHGAHSRLEQTRNDAQQRRLAGPVGAEQRETFAGIE
jgi:hypothetical protein